MIRSLVALALSGTASVADPQLEGPGLDVSLISETRSITPGQALTLGFHIHHHEGFHTYWKNPGIVGVPTSLKWTLPKGFTASEIKWPYPEETFMAEYPCHGYERDVTLLVTVTPPAVIESTSVTLKVAANWMCCAKGCFPNSQSLDITLPVTAKPVADARSAALIKKAHNELPQKSPDSKITVRGHKQIEIKILHPKITKTDEVYFFSSDGQISSDQKQSFSRGIDGSLILTVPRSEFSPEEYQSLPGVLKIGKQYLAIDPVFPTQ